MTFFRSALYLFLVFAATVIVKAQVPQVINYQSVVRDATGEIIKNKAVNFRLSLLDGGINGTPQYIEIQNKTTNQFGLVTFGIGQGTTVSGSMNLVTWSTGNKYLKVELDINGGNSFSLMSTSQFLSVPYALYAANGNTSVVGWGLSGNTITSANYFGTNNAQDLRFYTEGSQKMTLKPNGNVGIGTTIPSHRLRVETESDFSTYIDRIQLQLHNRSTNNESFGGLGISAGNSGTTTWLEHLSSTYSIYQSSYPDFNDLGYLATSGSNGLTLYSSSSSSNSKIRFAVGVNSNTAPFTRMTLNQIGLGLGTEMPKAKIEVANGDVYVSDPSKGIILKSPNGNCWRVTVDNTGNFVRTQITCP